MDRGAWQATVHEVAEELDMTQRLNNNKYMYYANVYRIYIIIIIIILTY